MATIEKFGKDFKTHLEDTFNASQEEHKVDKLAEAEATVNDYIDNFQALSGLKRIDIVNYAQPILDAFAQEKINYIQ